MSTKTHPAGSALKKVLSKDYKVFCGIFAFGFSLKIKTLPVFDSSKIRCIFDCISVFFPI